MRSLRSGFGLTLQCMSPMRMQNRMSSRGSSKGMPDMFWLCSENVKLDVCRMPTGGAGDYALQMSLQGRKQTPARFQGTTAVPSAAESPDQSLCNAGYARNRTRCFVIAEFARPPLRLLVEKLCKTCCLIGTRPWNCRTVVAIRSLVDYLNALIGTRQKVPDGLRTRDDSE